MLYTGQDSLNPFEVREVSKHSMQKDSTVSYCLNPFEVREVSKPKKEFHYVGLLQS